LRHLAGDPPFCPLSSSPPQSSLGTSFLLGFVLGFFFYFLQFPLWPASLSRRTLSLLTPERGAGQYRGSLGSAVFFCCSPPPPLFRNAFFPVGTRYSADGTFVVVFSWFPFVTQVVGLLVTFLFPRVQSLSSFRSCSTFSFWRNAAPSFYLHSIVFFWMKLFRRFEDVFAFSIGQTYTLMDYAWRRIRFFFSFSGSSVDFPYSSLTALPLIDLADGLYRIELTDWAFLFVPSVCAEAPATPCRYFPPTRVGKHQLVPSDASLKTPSSWRDYGALTVLHKIGRYERPIL